MFRKRPPVKKPIATAQNDATSRSTVYSSSTASKPQAASAQSVAAKQSDATDHDDDLNPSDYDIGEFDEDDERNLATLPPVPPRHQEVLPTDDFISFDRTATRNSNKRALTMLVDTQDTENDSDDDEEFARWENERMQHGAINTTGTVTQHKKVVMRRRVEIRVPVTTQQSKSLTFVDRLAVLRDHLQQMQLHKDEAEQIMKSNQLQVNELDERISRLTAERDADMQAYDLFSDVNVAIKEYLLSSNIKQLMAELYQWRQSGEFQEALPMLAKLIKPEFERLVEAERPADLHAFAAEHAISADLLQALTQKVIGTQQDTEMSK